MNLVIGHLSSNKSRGVDFSSSSISPLLHDYHVQHGSRKLTLSMALTYSLNMGLPTGNSQDLSGNSWETMWLMLELIWDKGTWHLCCIKYSPFPGRYNITTACTTHIILFSTASDTTSKEEIFSSTFP